MSSGNRAAMLDICKGLIVAVVGVELVERLCPAHFKWCAQNLVRLNSRVYQLGLQKAKAKAEAEAATAAKATDSNEKAA